jgi:hypothetical protein
MMPVVVHGHMIILLVIFEIASVVLMRVGIV